MNVWSSLAVVPAALAVLVLSSCATDIGFSDLERDATADDAWPSSLPGYAADNVDPESSRLVGFDGTTALYLAESTAPRSTVCLLVYPEGGVDWAVACGTSGMTVGGRDTAGYSVRADGRGDDAGAISDNVFTNRG